MQEAALHGWLPERRQGHVRMGGYPAKRAASPSWVTRLARHLRGQRRVLLAFAGRQRTRWAKQAMEIGWDESALVTRVAGERAGKPRPSGWTTGGSGPPTCSPERRVIDL